MPGGRQFWEQIKLGYNLDLRLHIDNILEERGDQMPPVGLLLPFYGAVTAQPLKPTIITEKNE